MVYTVSTKRYVGNKATIVEHDEYGHEIPVLHFIQGDTDFPSDIEKMAANLASLLNGNEPLHNLDIGANRLYWAEHKDGVSLRIKKPEGTSTTSYIACTQNSDIKERLTVTLMKFLCDSVHSQATAESKPNKHREQAFV